MYTITRNVCLTRLQKLKLEQHRRQIRFESDHTAAGNPVDLDLDLALGRLPEQYRRVLTLFYYEDKSHQAVSEMLDMPVATVKTHLHRARQRLRQILEEQQHAVRRV